MKSTEYLSNDILEEGHLKSFLPFRVIQMILGGCRVDARDRFVTSPSKAQKFYTIICILICTALYAYIVVEFLDKFWIYQNIYYLNLTTVLIHYATFLSNIIHIRFMNNDDNVKFYIKTQEIDRKLKIDKNEIINNSLFRSYIITVFLILIILLSLYASYSKEDILIFISFGGLMYGQLTCTLEWLYCANLLIFFLVRLGFVNAIMINHIEGSEEIKREVIKKTIYPTKKKLRSIAASQGDFEVSDTDVYLKDILEELVSFQRLYRFQLFLVCFKFVTNTLLVFEYGLLALQKNILTFLESIVLPTITAIDLLIVIVICIRWEAFSREIKNTKYLCTTIMSLYFSGPLRKKAAKMLKMITEKPPHISIYDMWQIDAATLISMINLVTTLMVTLLQFALL